MKKTIDLLNEVVEMGFNRESALSDIDACLDEELGFENRVDLVNEEISDELYEDILFGFKCETEAN
nr:MAG TPA: UBA-like domain protein [Caudoviricetes sp.]